MWCLQTPVAIVWIVGIVVALRRWRIHPRVSATVLGSVTCMLSAFVGQYIASSILISTLSGPTPYLEIYFQVTAAVVGLLGGVGWALILLASFGWRNEKPDAQGKPMQFSIRGLLIVTFVVAVLCGLMRGLGEVLGESATTLWGLIYYLPITISWLFGGWAVWARRRLNPDVAWRVGVAIGLQCVSLVATIAFIAHMTSVAATPGLSFFLILLWSITEPASWILLLTAAFGWRTPPAITSASPFRELPT